MCLFDLMDIYSYKFISKVDLKMSAECPIQIAQAQFQDLKNKMKNKMYFFD